MIRRGVTLDVYECPGCGFTYSADHTDDTSEGGYTCPDCGHRTTPHIDGSIPDYTPGDAVQVRFHQREGAQWRQGEFVGFTPRTREGYRRLHVRVGGRVFHACHPYNVRPATDTEAQG